MTSVAFAGLPDGRQYELVSPAQKLGYEVGIQLGVPATNLQLNDDGSRATWVTWMGLPQSNSGTESTLTSERTPTGWQTSSVVQAPGELQGGMGLPGDQDDEIMATTPDARTTVYLRGGDSDYGSLWIRRSDGSSARVLDIQSNPFLPGLADPPVVDAVSRDGRHVVFASDQAYVAGVPGPSFSLVLYEWTDDGANGTLRVVNRTNDLALTLIDSTSSASLGGSVANPSSRGISDARDAVSSDGSKIFFQNPAATGPLYVRENGTTTTEISAPQGTHSPAATVKYLDAATDGSVVYFYADGDLADGAPVDGGIYRYDVGSDQLTFVDSTGGSVPSAMASSDGSTLYYQRGADIYVHDDSRNRLVLPGAAIAGGASVGNSAIQQSAVLVGLKDSSCATANVTPDGRYFAFTASQGGGPLQAYRYDADTGSLVHVSASPTGPATASDVSFGAVSCRWSEVGGDPQLHTRAMSDDGQYVFFDTADALVPQDNNGMVDTYEWHDGHVSLVSGGTGGALSSFVSTDSRGWNALFVTRDSLVPEDVEPNSYDIYDARIGGGFPVAPPPPPPCSGDGCQAPPSQVPTTPDAGSATFVGPGNVVEKTTPAPSYTVTKISAAAQKRLASTGRLSVVVRVTGKGRVTASLSARTGKRFVNAGAASHAFTRAGRATLKLSLSKGARKYLASSHGGMRVRVDVSYTGTKATKQATFVLQSTAKAAKGSRNDA